MIEKHEISPGHAKMLVNRSDAIKLAKKIVKESLSVREVEELVKGNKKPSKAETTLDSSKLSPEDLKRRDLKNQYLRTVESKLSEIIGENLQIKASYDSNKHKGKISIAYNDLTQIEGLIKRLSDNLK